jgi:hypothetical protein
VTHRGRLVGVVALREVNLYTLINGRWEVIYTILFIIREVITDLILFFLVNNTGIFFPLLNPKKKREKI